MPTSTVTIRCEVESGSEAMLFITPAPPAPPSGVRLRNQSVAGISARIAMNQSSELRPLVIAKGRAQARDRRRMRSLGVTMSVRRMPNLSLTTTTSPWAIR